MRTNGLFELWVDCAAVIPNLYDFVRIFYTFVKCFRWLDGVEIVGFSTKSLEGPYPYGPVW